MAVLTPAGESDRDRFWRKVGENMNADPPAPFLKGNAAVIPDGPPLTADTYYAALAEHHMQGIAEDLNERFAHILPPGTRFEWTTAETEES